MGETILVILVLLSALYGCTELIGRLVMRLLYAPSRPTGLLVVPLAGKRTDLEQVVRLTTAHSRWAAGMTMREVVFVDQGMDEETRELAQHLCDEFPQVRLQSPQQAAQALQDLFTHTDNACILNE